MSRDRCISDSKLLGRGRPQIESPKKHRILGTREFKRTHLFALQIKQSALPAENLIRGVDPDVANQENIACVGVILRVVAEDAVFSVVNLDVVFSDRDALVEARVAICRDFHGRIAEIAELGAGKRHQKQKAQTIALVI